MSGPGLPAPSTQTAPAVPPPAPGHPHAHAAAVVGSDAEWLATALPYVEAGLRADDLVVLSCRGDRAALIGVALGEQAGHVPNDPSVSLLGARPPDVFARWHTLERVARGRGSGRLRLLVDVDVDGEPADRREAQRFDSVVNVILRAAPVAVLCTYDRPRLPAEVIESVAATHPVLLRGVRWRPNPGYRTPEVYVPALPLPREPVEDGEPLAVVEDAPGLAVLRRRIGEALATCVPDAEQRDDLHLALAEIAANAFRHGAPPVSARIWADADRIVCAVSDCGSSAPDVLAGFVPAHGEDLSRGGMGLWLARKLWDHVDVLPQRGGVTVRLSTRLHAAT